MDEWTPIPQIKYVDRAECTVEDDGKLISLYVEINPDPNRSVYETHPIMDTMVNIDVDEKGNVRGIEILATRETVSLGS